MKRFSKSIGVLLVAGAFAASGSLYAMPNPGYYERLNIEKSATAQEIRRAYRTLALQYHPDKPGGNAEQFKKIGEAYEVLSDFDKRARYDDKLAQNALFHSAINEALKSSMRDSLNNFAVLQELLIYFQGNPTLVNIIDDYGNTPLLLAVQNNNLNTAQILLNLGANPNVKNRASYTPLYFAVYKRNSDMARLLLKYGANPNLGIAIPENSINQLSSDVKEKFNTMREYYIQLATQRTADMNTMQKTSMISSDQVTPPAFIRPVPKQRMVLPRRQVPPQSWRQWAWENVSSPRFILPAATFTALGAWALYRYYYGRGQ